MCLWRDGLPHVHIFQPSGHSWSSMSWSFSKYKICQLHRWFRFGSRGTEGRDRPRETWMLDIRCSRLYHNSACMLRVEMGQGRLGCWIAVVVDYIIMVHVCFTGDAVLWSTSFSSCRHPHPLCTLACFVCIVIYLVAIRICPGYDVHVGCPS